MYPFFTQITKEIQFKSNHQVYPYITTRYPI
jgi:hypothetical protein